MKPMAIDLFCGLGGWTDGLLAEGYDVTGFDIEEHVYGEHRYPARLVVQDVLTLHGSQFRDAALIVASPPCQEYSYMAMPWKLAKAKAAAIRADATGQKFADLTRLFYSCFRIQREACEAAGRHIPLVVENVKGAQPWVGRARWNYGSFYLWGDVPALMPTTIKGQKFNPDGTAHPTGSWFKIADSKNRGARGAKNNGGSWFNVGSPGQKVTSKNPVHELTKAPARVSETPPTDGRKGVGTGAAWFDQNTSSLPSSSPRRKMASALIAKIPLPLSRHIARTYHPGEVSLQPTG